MQKMPQFNILIQLYMYAPHILFSKTDFFLHLSLVMSSGFATR